MQGCSPHFEKWGAYDYWTFFPQKGGEGKAFFTLIWPKKWGARAHLHSCYGAYFKSCQNEILCQGKKSCGPCLSAIKTLYCAEGLTVCVKEDALSLWKIAHYFLPWAHSLLRSLLLDSVRWRWIHNQVWWNPSHVKARNISLFSSSGRDPAFNAYAERQN